LKWTRYELQWKWFITESPANLFNQLVISNKNKKQKPNISDIIWYSDRINNQSKQFNAKKYNEIYPGVIDIIPEYEWFHNALNR
jgi:hypothetical protein